MTPKQETPLQTQLSVAHHDFEKGLYSHADWKLHDRTKSDDLVQDTFLKTWSYLVKGGKIELMRAFLFHVLNDLIIDEYRRKKTTSLETLVDEGFEPIVDTSEQSMDKLDARAMLGQIRYLPTKYEQILRMRYERALTIEEIAVITGQTKNTIAVQIHRGLGKLRVLAHVA